MPAPPAVYARRASSEDVFASKFSFDFVNWTSVCINMFTSCAPAKNSLLTVCLINSAVFSSAPGGILRLSRDIGGKCLLY